MHTNSGEIVERSHNMSVYDVPAGVREEYTLNAALLTESEQRQMATWNQTQQSYPQDVCVPQLVARQATATPHAIALVAGEQRLTYHDLNQRANQLAHFLQSAGVGPGVLVGLCLERSLEMVVGLLGILKAGGAYVPLDPSYPKERLAFMIEDAQAPLLLTQQHLSSRLSSGHARVVCLDAQTTAIAQHSSAEPLAGISAGDLVYLIYTSGSTGRPKGVQVTHGSLLNLVYWHQRVFAVSAADRATQLTSPAFDAAGWELWPYLTMGARVVILDEESRVAPALCRDWLVEQAITIAFLPTALAEGVMALEWPAHTALRYLLTGADTLRHYPSPRLPFRLVNNYGPTEASVVATSGIVPPAEQATEAPTIGRPIDNVQVYILDEHRQPVPIGEPGELHIGGAGLARGYLNRPDLTAERFIAHPFSADPSARLYKTGDRARFLPNGHIAFLGRIDQQIKMRGYRIEPQEIMAVLESHPQVQTSMVIAREDTPGDKRLVAYVVPVAGARMMVTSLRERLAERLPDYMIPASFVRLDALPLTPNGKVDQRALPMPDRANSVGEEAVVEARSMTEERVVWIVAPLLGVEQLSIDDNFFLLGGHSLLGTQVIAHVAAAFGVELSLRTLFSAPTIRQLSAEIQRLLIAKLETMSEDEAARLLGQGPAT